MFTQETADSSQVDSVLPYTGTFTKVDESFIESVIGPIRLDDNPLLFLEVNEFTVIENARLEVMTSVVPEPSSFLIVAGAVLVALRGRFRRKG